MEEDELQALQEAVQAHWPQMDKSDELDREKDMQWYNELKDRRWENTNILRRVLVRLPIEAAVSDEGLTFHR